MRKAGGKWIAIVVAVILVLAAAAGAFFTLERFVVVEGHLYKRNESALDLRERDVTCSAYDKLKKKLPGCTILWNVPFQGEKYPSFTSELTVETLTDEDVETLDYFPQLEVLQAQECQDYPQLMEVIRRKPNCQVNYHVQIDGRTYDQSAATVKVTNLTQEDVDKMAYLPKLRTVNAQKCYNYVLLLQLKQDHPNWDVNFNMRVGGQLVDLTATALTVTGATAQELSGVIPAMQNLKTVEITNPQATGEELRQLRIDNPNVTIHWSIQVGDRTVPETAQEVDLTGLKLTST